MAEPNKTTLPKSASTELGKSGTLISHGHISNEEYNRNLTGVSGNRIYEIMRRSDSTVRSALQIVKLPILSVSWDIEAAKNAEGEVEDFDQEVADKVKRELFQRKINFIDMVKSALTSLDFGFSVFEKVFEAVEHDGKLSIGYAKISPRKQVSIEKWTTPDDQPGVTQRTNEGSFGIPREKLAIFTHDKEGDNYEGISLLRYIYKDWDIKDKLVLVNAIALERQGVGVPIVRERTGETAAPGDQEAAEDALANLRANEAAYLKIPKTMEVEMMDMKGSTTKEIIPTLNYHDARIMTGVLARFMELGGASGSGSQSLAGDLSSIFMKAEEALANELISTITEDIIKPLCDLNYSNLPNGYPKLTHGAIADDDTVALANSVSQLVTAGAITPDQDLEENLRTRYNLPQMSEEAKKAYDHEDDLGDTNVSKKKDAPVKEKELKELKDEEDIKAALDDAKYTRSLLLASLRKD